MSNTLDDDDFKMMDLEAFKEKWATSAVAEVVQADVLPSVSNGCSDALKAFFCDASTEEVSVAARSPDLPAEEGFASE